MGTLVAQGCQVTSQDIATWKRTEKGPGKLRSALSDTALPIGLRAEAAAALCDIHRGEEVEDAITTMPEATRKTLLHKLVPALARVVTDGIAESKPTSSQIEAKDCLYRLRTLGDQEGRVLAEQTLTAWTTADLLGRMSAGAYGTEVILLAMPTHAQEALVKLLGSADGKSPQVLPAAALLGRVGDVSHKGQGAEILTRLLPPVPSEADQAMLRALGSLGGDVAKRYLRGIIEDRAQRPSLRKLAWLSVRESGDPSLLQVALRMAWDKGEAPGVREAAFAYLEKVGQIAVDGLTKIIKDPKDASETGEVTRFRAVEAALGAGRQGAVLEVLEALPAQRSYSQEDLVSYVVHQITPIGKDARAPLKQALRSPSWVARVCAIIALSELGQKEDEADLLALKDDTTGLRAPGFSKKTVGELAQEHALRLRTAKR